MGVGTHQAGCGIQGFLDVATCHPVPFGSREGWEGHGLWALPGRPRSRRGSSFCKIDEAAGNVRGHLFCAAGREEPPGSFGILWWRPRPMGIGSTAFLHPCAILDITEGGCWSAKEAERVIYGDNTAALAIVQSPSGPWRTRRLRLRSNVLRERVREGEWQIRNLPGSGLVADYLTKAVAARTQWLRFYSMAGMIKDESEVVSRPGPGEADGGRVIGKEAAVKVAATCWSGSGIVSDPGCLLGIPWSGCTIRAERPMGPTQEGNKIG